MNDLNADLPMFAIPGDQNTLNIASLRVELPAGLVQSSVELLEYHRHVLEAAGVTDLAQLGALRLGGVVAPQRGITVPRVDLFETHQVVFQRATRAGADGITPEPFDGIARVLKAKQLPTFATL